MTAKFSDLVAWNHSWDFAEAITYSDGSNIRIAAVPDPSGFRPMVRDSGPWSDGFVGGTATPLSPLPGPVFVPGAPGLRGRSAASCDPVYTSAQTGSYALYATLSPQVDPTDPSEWFEIPQPYWVAILGYGSNLIDGFNGQLATGTTVTVSSANGFRQVVNSLGGPVATTSIPVTSNGSLTIVTVNGAASVVEEINSTGQASAVVNLGSTNRTAKDMFIGYVHGVNASTLSAVGLKAGTPTEVERDVLAAWADRHLVS